MAGINIYQIYYDDQTRASLDPGFIPLDNSENQRPDWYEYHPIRNFLLRNELVENSFYGFFSPRFAQKTGLSSAEVHSFVARHSSSEVILFSPFLDQCAFFQSIFEQGEVNHAGLIDAVQKVADACKINVEIRKLVTDSGNTVFCNYFVAKPDFWRKWLQLGEKLYAMAESASAQPNIFTEIVPYGGKRSVQLKVFVAERLASLLLSIRPVRKVVNYEPTKLPLSNHSLSRFRHEIVALDALKFSFRTTGRLFYLQNFFNFRTALIKDVKETQKASLIQSAGAGEGF